jgi:hypothetical protein
MKTPEEAVQIFDNLRSAMKAYDEFEEQAMTFVDDDGIVDEEKLIALFNVPGRLQTYGDLIHACRDLVNAHQEVVDEWKNKQVPHEVQK